MMAQTTVEMMAQTTVVMKAYLMAMMKETKTDKSMAEN